MPAFNFKYRFARKVETGEKRHTIRAPRKDGKLPNVGDAFYGYEGMRTRKCRKLLTSSITGVQSVRIELEGGIYIDGRKLAVKEADRLAVADGFTSVTELYEFFKAEHGLPFEGHLIHWAYPDPLISPADSRRPDQ